MTVLKQRISSPLEAGRSILDTHNLPPQVTGAFEYTSKRLARKGLHITLIAARSECQLPNAPPCATPTSPPHTPDYSASRFPSPSFSGLRQLVRRGTGSPLAPSRSTSTSSSSSLDSASGGRWILPLTPGSPLPSTPMTPLTPSSIATTTSTTSSYNTPYGLQGPESFGIRLVYASPVSFKDRKTLHTTLSKAERKFHTGIGALSTITTASACGLSSDIMRRSIEQNEVLFSSDGMTLLGLDRLYTFKAALAAYARSIVKSPPQTQTSLISPGLSNHPVTCMSPTSPSTTTDSTRLEDAVDSLRRLVLSNGGRPIAKADLYRSFDWIGVNSTALAEVEHMYRRAYGGPERRGPFEVPPMILAETPQVRRAEVKQIRVVKLGTPPPPKTTPVLKLNTNIATKPKPVRPTPMAVPRISTTDLNTRATPRKTIMTGDGNNDSKPSKTGMAGDLVIRVDDINITGEEKGNCCSDGDDGDRTAHPLRDGPLRPSMFWPNGTTLASSIDELLSPYDERQSQRIGPTTPNGYDDISPITRGEWGFLFKGDNWSQGRTAVVETC
ncbi:hypothetical protein GGS20DRAFT_2058 [Poronia punctata]|nr:hypothetical protein GGS20DRAFT_2058 [Poronia punctata]